MSEKLGTLLSRVGSRLCSWGLALEEHRLRDVPKCPDCRIAPLTDEDCPVCLDMQRQEERERDIYDAGFDGGWERAEERLGRGF